MRKEMLNSHQSIRAKRHKPHSDQIERSAICTPLTTTANLLPCQSRGCHSYLDLRVHVSLVGGNQAFQEAGMEALHWSRHGCMLPFQPLHHLQELIQIALLCRSIGCACLSCVRKGCNLRMDMPIRGICPFSCFIFASSWSSVHAQGQIALQSLPLLSGS